MTAGARLGSLIADFEGAEEFPQGSVVFTEHEKGECMYVVKSGLVGIAIDGKQVTQLGPGEIFGEMSLIDKSARSATATALEDCQLVPVDEKRFLYMVNATPYFALEVMKVLASRIRGMNGLL